MGDFKIVFYAIIVMFALLTAVFLWGFISFIKIKNVSTKFLNKPLLTMALSINSIGLILTFIPIFMKIWNYDELKPELLILLIFELLFLVIMISIAYFFAGDYGIAVSSDNKTLHLFGDSIPLSKIMALEEGKYSLKIVYIRGSSKQKKKLPIFSPNAKAYIRTVLPSIIAENIARENANIVATDNVNNLVVEPKKVDETTIVVNNDDKSLSSEKQLEINKKNPQKPKTTKKIVDNEKK